MDQLVREFIKNGKPVNELMDMPYQFVVDILREKVEAKKETSLISAFGG